MLKYRNIGEFQVPRCQGQLLSAVLTVCALSDGSAMHGGEGRCPVQLVLAELAWRHPLRPGIVSRAWERGWALHCA